MDNKVERMACFKTGTVQVSNYQKTAMSLQHRKMFNHFLHKQAILLNSVIETNSKFVLLAD